MFVMMFFVFVFVALRGVAILSRNPQNLILETKGDDLIRMWCVSFLD